MFDNLLRNSMHILRLMFAIGGVRQGEGPDTDAMDPLGVSRGVRSSPGTGTYPGPARNKKGVMSHLLPTHMRSVRPIAYPSGVLGKGGRGS